MTSINERHYTIGIAGHIDHGKTTLTKALTGKETDRLKEEQQRKISIELGFASFTLSQGEQVGVIDVPGHERFIRQMVAGVAGIDMVLLVIAADEGVMPQTKEHLEILQILGVQKGIIVFTKADTVDAEFLDIVKETTREAVENTFLQDSLMLEVDSLSGRGIADLKHAIEQSLSTIPARASQGIVRLPIDRAFSVKGFGTVVTGTLYHGKIELGDELELLPLNQSVKVRHLQIHDQSQQAAFAGQRVAVNITDVQVDDIKRGYELATVGSLEPTTRLDISLELLPDLDFSLKQRSEIRLHLATSEIIGRIIFFDRNECLPGEKCYAQLELEEAVTTTYGDRYVLRRPTPMTTLGGGMIIDPYAVKHRFGQRTVELIEAKESGDIFTRALQLLNQEGIMLLKDLVHQLGASLEDFHIEIESLKEKGLYYIGDSKQKQSTQLICSQAFWDTTWDNISKELLAFHEKFPLREGPDRLTIQQKYFPALKSAQWAMVLSNAEAEQLVVPKGESIAAPSFIPTLPPALEKEWQQIQAQMATKGIEVDVWSNCFSPGISPALQHDLLHFLLKRDDLILLEEGRYLARHIFEAIVHDLKAKTPEAFSIQEVRDVINTSRKYLIPFLEALDKYHYTLRKETTRVWKN